MVRVDDLMERSRLTATEAFRLRLGLAASGLNLRNAAQVMLVSGGQFRDQLAGREVVSEAQIGRLRKEQAVRWARVRRRIAQAG